MTLHGWRTACLAALVFLLPTAVCAEDDVVLSGASARLQGVRDGEGGWGVGIGEVGLAAVQQPRPAALELWTGQGDPVVRRNAAYTSLRNEKGELVARARIDWEKATFEFEDRWRVEGSAMRLNRTVRVRGNSDGGFLSQITLEACRPMAWPEVKWFVPGMIYGGFENLDPQAIGGCGYYGRGGYTIRIREDRLPAPLVVGQFKDGWTWAILDPSPDGGTSAAEGQSVRAGVMIEPRMQLGAIGGQESGSKLELGYWFPGSEGEQTYQGDTYPGGQVHQWRRRFHPIRDGFVQHYEVAFRFHKAEGFPAACGDAWRWAWQTLRPKVHRQDIDALRRALVDVLAANVIEVGDRAGIPNACPSAAGSSDPADNKTVLGFTGKGIEVAEMLLAESARDGGQRGVQLREKGERLIASFLRLKVAPPEGEGFFLNSGKPTTALGHVPGHTEVYLRSYGDDMKALLRAYERERTAGRDHPQWLAWARQFADWMLAQQQPAGGFPRAWMPPDGAVFSDSPNASFNAIGLLVLLQRVTGCREYLAAAIRAGDFCWNHGQSENRFVGGTIDNPDVIDKEAGTLSLEAYLALYDATSDPKWLVRARAAADFAETWIYLWDVPMPVDADEAQLHFKRGVPTTGFQLIATGHSLVDAYMSFDVDEFTRLYRHTSDEHYLEVARLLLHNTKAMIALPGRLYDLRGPGWQQEHFSLAPRRGFGLHRLWLPWVATSQLNGIVGLMEFDRALYEKLAHP